MADFSISGNMKVGTLKKRFKENFGSTLRVYKGKKFADDELTVASLATESIQRGAEVKAHGRMKVGNFESKLKESFGIIVQVATADDSKLVDNSLSLSESGDVSGRQTRLGSDEKNEVAAQKSGCASVLILAAGVLGLGAYVICAALKI